MPKVTRLSSRFVASAVLALVAGAAAAAGAPASAPPVDPPRVDPAAVAALDRMGAYLQTLTAFEVRAHVQREDVLDDGMKVQHVADESVLARRPNRLRADLKGERRHREFFFDGRTFTMHAPRLDYYATVPAPATIDALARELEERFGIEFPLVDMFRFGSPDAPEHDFVVAMDLGASTIDGTSCEHYAFRQSGADWQVWIQQGDFPLPRKMVITTTTDEARPQYQATYTWNLAPAFNESAFTFTPPPGARKIPLNEKSIADAAAPATTPEPKSKLEPPPPRARGRRTR